MTIRGERHYLWRAVDQDGDVIDILVQRYRSARAAKRFFSQAAQATGKRAVEAGDGPAQELLCGPPENHALRDPRDETLSEQSS